MILLITATVVMIYMDTGRELMNLRPHEMENIYSRKRHVERENPVGCTCFLTVRGSQSAETRGLPETVNIDVSQQFISLTYNSLL